MKVLVVLLLSLAATQAVSVFNGVTIPPSDQCDRPNNPGLGGELQDFIALLPLEAMIDAFFDAIIMDEEVREFVNYLASDEFEAVVALLRYNKAFINVLEYLCEELHLDAYFYLNALGELLGVAPVTRPPRLYNQISQFNGVKGLIDTMAGLIPSEEMLDLWFKKVEDPNGYMCRFYNKLGSDEFRAMTEEMENDPAFIAFTKDLQRFGLDTYIMIDWLKAFLWERDYC